MTTMAIIGSRNFNDYPFMKERVQEVLSAHPTISAVVSGGARGADAMSERIASEFGLTHQHFRADWGRYGRGAGPIRNQQIIDAADLIVAFPLGKSSGTYNAITKAEKANKRVKIYPL
jgi:hypothetical protein